MYWRKKSWSDVFSFWEHFLKLIWNFKGDFAHAVFGLVFSFPLEFIFSLLDIDMTLYSRYVFKRLNTTVLGDHIAIASMKFKVFEFFLYSSCLYFNRWNCPIPQNVHAPTKYYGFLRRLDYWWKYDFVDNFDIF